jgi:hypothetical protein
MNKKNNLTKQQKRVILKHFRALVRSMTMRHESEYREPGYLYLRIKVEDVDGGDIVPQEFYTYCKPSDFRALLDRIEKAARHPPKLLSRTLGVPLMHMANDSGKTELVEILSKDRTVKQVVDNRLSGGKQEDPGLRRCYDEWKAGGYKRETKRRLKKEYAKDETEAENFERNMKRFKRRDKTGT